MKNFSKKFIISVLAAVLLLTPVLSLSLFAADYTLDIKYCNLSFRDTTYIKYAVDTDSDSAKLLVWTKVPEGGYIYGTQDALLSNVGTQVINGREYKIFDFSGLATSRMTDDVYARAYLDGKYGALQKYSILQYAYNMLGKTGTETEDTQLVKTLQSLLEHGANAQREHGYKTDRLATDSFYQLKLVGGEYPDHTNTGLYLCGQIVSISAPSKNTEGELFSHWENSNGAIVSRSTECNVTVENTNDTYTAVYGTERYTEGLSYSLNSDEQSYTVKGIGTAKDRYIVIPPEYNGKPVTRIGERAFSFNTELTGVKISANVESIENYAFYGCTGLTNVLIPKSVTSIGGSAFYNCFKLVEVNNRSDLDITYGSTDNGHIGYYALNILTSLSGESNITEDAGGYVFYNDGQYKFLMGCNGNEAELVLPNGENGEYAVYPYAFYKNSSIKSITISDGVSEIGEQAFYGCIGLESVTMADSVKEIGSFAFFNCTELANVELGNGVTGIGTSAFKYCRKLTDLVIPESTNDIAEYAFMGCPRLNSISVEDGNEKYKSVDNCLVDTESGVLVLGCVNSIIPSDENIIAIGNNAFYGVDLESLVLPDNISQIGSFAFSGCSKLSSVTLGNKTEYMGDYAFADCQSLTSVTLPVGTEEIGFYAFSGCIGLTDIVIPDSVEIIYGNAFSDCTGLVNVTVAEGVLVIWDHAFSGCTRLSNIAIPESVFYVGEYAFDGCSGVIREENGVKYVGKWVIGCDRKVTNAEIRNDTVGIAGAAFKACTRLKDIIIPESVQFIGNDAFFRCTSFENITIPGSVLEMGDGVFNGCTGLKNVMLGNGIENIGEYAFAGCSGIENIVIPDSVAVIGESAFENCTGLKNVSLGSGLTYIGDYVFYGCTSLKTVCYNGTIDEWNKIEKGKDWDLGLTDYSLVTL